jgi:hypothetical protein
MKATLVFFISLGTVVTLQGHAQQPQANNSVHRVTLGGLVSFPEFQLAFTSQPSTTGGPYPSPDTKHYEYLVQKAGNGLISSKEEFAMFLAHVIQESGGQHFKEISCQCANYAVCSWAQPETGPGCYCGRGALQLSFPCNYAQASHFLYGDDRLLKNPESVATSIPDIWGTALYYWRTVVHQHAVTGDFSKTTAAINGPCECDSVEGDCYGSPKAIDKGAKRCNIYNTILTAWKLPAKSPCSQC